MRTHRRQHRGHGHAHLDHAERDANLTDHVAECTIDVDADTADLCTPGHVTDEHEIDHVHGAACGHEPVPHGDHIDYLVGSHLHHPHGSHCDDHGTV